jgi:hypothetical protein
MKTSTVNTALYVFFIKFGVGILLVPVRRFVLRHSALYEAAGVTLSARCDDTCEFEPDSFPGMTLRSYVTPDRDSGAFPEQHRQVIDDRLKLIAIKAEHMSVLL